MGFVCVKRVHLRAIRRLIFALLQQGLPSVFPSPHTDNDTLINQHAILEQNKKISGHGLLGCHLQQGHFNFLKLFLPKDSLDVTYLWFPECSISNVCVLYRLYQMFVFNVKMKQLYKFKFVEDFRAEVF